MARISELHYSNAYARDTGVSEFLEVALAPDEDPADFTVGFYDIPSNSATTATQGIAISLDDPGVVVTYDADADEFVYVISADVFPILLTDPTSGAPDNYEAFALVDTSTNTVIDFYDIGDGAGEVTATDGVAAGATSENLPAPTGPNQATYTLQFNKPNKETLVYEAVDPGGSGAICFVAGTMISTPTGLRAVETLAPGDLVLTEDAGAQRILWTGSDVFLGTGHLAPVVIEAGIFGNTSKVRLSPQHRVLQQGWPAQLTFGLSEVLVPAQRLVGLPGVSSEHTDTVTYCHFLLPRHHLVKAGGLLCESFYPGDVALSTLKADPRGRLLDALHDPAAGLGGYGDLVRPVEDRQMSVALAAYA